MLWEDASIIEQNLTYSDIKMTHIINSQYDILIVVILTYYDLSANLNL